MRIVICLILGVLVGFFLGFTTAAATPLNYPGMWLGQLLADTGLGPSGDAGFIVYCWGALLQWVLVGLVIGSVWQWRFRRSQSPNKHLQSTPR